MNSTTSRYLKALPALLFLTVLDLGTKHWITTKLSRGQSMEVIPGFFHLTLVHNTGAAFGIGTKWSMPFFVVTSLIALAVVGYLFIRLTPKEKYSFFGLILIMSGAIGNLVDRIRLGYVVDFLDIFIGKYHWPAFNVADSAITVGAICYAIDLVWPKKENITES